MPRLSKIGAAALAAFGWTAGGATSVTASYLIVAGGGSGGYGNGGGGGAGGLQTGTTSLNSTLSYTVIVGAGGPSTAVSGNGTAGSNSVFGSLTASVGGGYAGGGQSPYTGGNGGSGGGSGSYGSGTVSGGTGTSGQGNNGGSNGGYAAPGYPTGGGGGAGAAGSNASGTTTAGNGGAGAASSISGSSVTYAGGGGGGISTGTAGAGGAGGGGNGSSGGSGSNGTQNTGGGGGGSASATSGAGGSGIVIISYLGAQQFGGGVVTSVGGYTIHTFTTSGTLSPLSSLSADYLIVAGGGGGTSGAGGGGGAGGLLAGSATTIDTNSTYVVTVGSGGPSGTVGGNSSFSIVATSAVGGGSNGTNGGSGYGIRGTPAGSGTAGQGNAGGTSAFTTGAGVASGGGGGGAGAAGANGASNVGGNGGNGTTSSISGTATTYAGGGGGGIYMADAGGGTGGTGGTGGGGYGGINYAGGNGTANLGSGGGGGGLSNAGGSFAGGSGGSGIVIIRYAGSVQQMAGGTVTIAGGYVIHTFTNSGYLAPLKLVNNSLRFRASNSGYLSRSITATPTAQNTWTYSAWVKRGQLGISANILSSNGTQVQTLFTSGDNFQFYVNNALNVFVTTQVFRDPAAWYHIVLAVNSSASGTDKVKLYVNGVQVTSFSTDNRSSFSTSAINQTGTINTIGNYGQGLNNYFDGEMANVQFIDGQQLTPNSFGTFNSYGIWQPITYGGSYGTNGFYLPMNSTQSYTGVFSGSSQWVSVPNLAAFSVGTSNYTVEGWFYFNSLPSTQGLFGCDNGSGSTPKFLGLVNSSGAVLLEFTNTGGATFLTSSSGVVTTGKWYHIAWVRNSGTSTIYVNGNAVGATSTSVNLAGLTQPWNIGYIGEAGPSSLAGYASNFRLVTGTAVYTSNFTPPTTALTAISGTQILTLQNATLVDNSSNAQTVTNTGGVTTGATYPFNYLANVVKDYGPSVNNWTANNIGFTTGSTLDVMTDVPTLTSTTAANYCVWNPLDANIMQSGSSVISNGNLTAADNATSYGTYCRGTIWQSTGKWYWEITCTSIGDIYGNIGFCNSSQTGVFYQSSGQRNPTAYNTGTNSYGSSYTTGDVIGVALDLDANSVTFYKNNTSQGAVSFSSGTYAPAVGDGSNGSQYTFNANFGQQPFVYTPPSGYVALNTYNL